MRNIRVIEIRSEFGAGTRGASLGVDAIKMASLNKGSDFFSIHKPITVVVADHSRLFENKSDRPVKYINEILLLERTIHRVVAGVARESFPIIIGGDHSIGAGTIMGIKKAYPDKRIGVIWIDAHADLHTPYTTPSGNMHGMPLAMCLGEDNSESGKNKLTSSEADLWEQLKETGGKAPKIAHEDIVFIGLREMEKSEQTIVADHNIRAFSVKDVKDMSPEEIAGRSLERLKACDLVCVSFDVDSMDPDTVSGGTGTPVPGGLSAADAKTINTLLVRAPKVASWEVVEINPLLDNKNKMAETAFDILESVAESLI